MVADKCGMRAVAQRIVWIVGLFCLVFGVAGIAAFSPVTIALSVTGWFLARASYQSLERQADIAAPTPDLQYWARTTLLRAVGLMVLGAIIAAGFVAGGVSFHLSIHEQVLLTALLIAAMVAVTRLTLPSFFAASWEVHGAHERRQQERSSTAVARYIVRAVAVMLVIVSAVGSFAFLQSIRLGAPIAGAVAFFSPSGPETR